MAAGDKGYDCTCHFVVIAKAERWPEAIAAEFLMSPEWLGRGAMQMQIFISNMLIPIEAASIPIPLKNRKIFRQCHNFPLVMGERVSCGYRNLKQLPSALLSATYFTLKVLPVGDLLSLGLLTSVCVFSSTL